MFGYNVLEFFEFRVLFIQFFYCVFIKFVVLVIGCGFDGNVVWFVCNEAGKIGYKLFFGEKEMCVIGVFYIVKSMNGIIFQKKYFVYWCFGVDQFFIFWNILVQCNFLQVLVYFFIELNNFSNYVLYFWCLKGVIR